MFETIRKERELNKDKKFPALFMWNGRRDKNWLRWAAHTAECFMDLKIQTDFQVNYAMQGHEIISDEIIYVRKWVERMIPNLAEMSMINKVNKRMHLFLVWVTVQSLEFI